jgi:hypothetical protein
MKAFLPRPDGYIECPQDCTFKTKDIFELLDHMNVEYAWAVKIDKKYSFDMFEFLAMLNDHIVHGEYEEVGRHIQSAATLFINASNGTVGKFFEETIVQEQLPRMYKELDKILEENE